VTALFTGWRDPEAEGPFSHWVAAFRRGGIDLAELRPDELPRIDCPHLHARRAYLAYLWILERHRRRAFDVIHFPDTAGHGYFCTLAKRQGRAFLDATLVVGIHSPSLWIAEAHRAPFERDQERLDDFIERGCVAMADVAIAPSAYLLNWMTEQGWQLPKRHFVQPYVRSSMLRGWSVDSEERASSGRITEIVFFGRLEPRKGLTLFCDALDRLAGDEPPCDVTVSFLGKEADVNGLPAREYLARRAERWPWKWQVRSELGAQEAISYLKRPGGSPLAVMPSLSDNVPNTVLEALMLKIPFIASRVGGIPELIDPSDLERCTFDPAKDRDGERRLDPTSLASKLRDALAASAFSPPRPAIDPEQNESSWVEWHQRAAVRRPVSRSRTRSRLPGALVNAFVVGSGGAESAASLAGQDFGSVELVPVDGADPEDRNTACRASEAEYLFFLRAPAIAEPGCVEALVRASERTPADVVSCVTRVGDAERSGLRVPVGGPPLAGLLYPCFGDVGYLIRRQAFERLGGFSTRAEAGSEDDELLCRAALAGVRTTVVPDALLSLPDREVAMATGGTTLRPTSTMLSVARLYEAQERHLDGLAVLTQALWRFKGDWEETDLHARQARADWERLRAETEGLWSEIERLNDELGLAVARNRSLVNSSSWRLTRPFRALGEIARRARGRR
jgi:glycosyltransferase involved in cell wall biosynthesis